MSTPQAELPVPFESISNLSFPPEVLDGMRIPPVFTDEGQEIVGLASKWDAGRPRHTSASRKRGKVAIKQAMH